jgi:hypothetical protein
LASLAIVFTIAGLLAHLMPGVDAGSRQFISGLLWKLAMVLAIAWLAAPQLERLGWQRLRGTMLILVVIVVILYAIRPRIGAIAALLIVGLSLLAAVTGWLRRLTKQS